MIKIINDALYVVIFSLLILLGISRYDIHFLNKQIGNLQSENAKLNIAIDNAQQAYKEQAYQLKIREQEADKKIRKSQQDMNNIMNIPIDSDCQNAVQFAVSQAHFLYKNNSL